MKNYLAEFIGTFILVFMTCGAVSFTGGYSGYLGVVGIALVFGFTAAAVWYIFGKFSGAHCNPAVSAGMLTAGKLSLVDFMGYVVCQVLGGICAGFALYGLSRTFDEDVLSQYEAYGYDLVSLGTNGYADAAAFLKISVWGALAVEAFLSFVFVLAFICVTADKAYRSVAGIVAGMALGAVELFGMTITGAGVNPARSFGTALAKAVFDNVTALSQVWVFIIAPLAGGVLAGLCFLIFNKGQKPAKKAETAVEKTAEESEEKPEERMAAGESAKEPVRESERKL